SRTVCAARKRSVGNCNPRRRTRNYIRAMLPGTRSAPAWTALLLVFHASSAIADVATAPTFTMAQAESGRTVYRKHCTQCHGGNLMGGDSWGSGPPLAGDAFMAKWGATPLRALYELMRVTMPP